MEEATKTAVSHVTKQGQYIVGKGNHIKNHSLNMSYILQVTLNHRIVEDTLSSEISWTTASIRATA